MPAYHESYEDRDPRGDCNDNGVGRMLSHFLGFQQKARELIDGVDKVIRHVGCECDGYGQKHCEDDNKDQS